MHRAIARDVVAANASRIVYGTDWPNIPYPYEGELSGLWALGLDEAELRAITRENARRLTPALARFD
jgi:hypothetical protein